jgi:hypothetical protein
MMKRTLTGIACLLMLATAFAQEPKKSAPARAASEENASSQPLLAVAVHCAVLGCQMGSSAASQDALWFVIVEIRQLH